MILPSGKRAEETLREREEKLCELNAQKDKFFSIIAHDLINPFNSIVGFSELLMDEMNEKNYEEIDEYAKIIKQSTQQVMDLLLNLAWNGHVAQTGRIKFKPENF